jgi:hypothetical protein
MHLSNLPEARVVMVRATLGEVHVERIAIEIVRQVPASFIESQHLEWQPS